MASSVTASHSLFLQRTNKRSLISLNKKKERHFHKYLSLSLPEGRHTFSNFKTFIMQRFSRLVFMTGDHTFPHSWSTDLVNLSP